MARAKRSVRRASGRTGDALGVYRRKRDFKRTPEPKARLGSSRGGDRYLIQKHAARRLHYDFRVELDGVLLSWAVPNGPSLDPADRRLAVRTENHPLDYGDFEGVIPAGQYGGGTVMLWDKGTWSPTKDPRDGLKRGHLEFELNGERLKGGWILARMRPKPKEKGKENWLLIKRHDAHQRPGAGASLVEDALTSAASGRTMEQIAAERSRVWSSGTGEIKADSKRQRRPAPRRRRPDLPKAAQSAAKAKMPDFIPPQLATLVSDPPPGANWVHEIKFDGYRTQAHIDRGRVRMLTRSGLDWTDKFKPVAQALKALAVDRAIIDGEIVVQDSSGVTNFGDLQQALSEGRTGELAYYAFDLLYLDGRLLTKLPLLERKAALKAILTAEGAAPPILFSDHLSDRGPEFFQQACRLALEGTIAKRADARYSSGRSRTWLKAKCTRRQEFVVGGWTSSTAAGRDLRSLLIGYFDGRRFRYGGKVGTGFNAATSATLLAALRKAPRRSSPFDAVPKEVMRGAHWVEPRVVVEVEFANWTQDRVVRHASFKGQRKDKAPTEIALEIPIDEKPAVRSAPAARDHDGVALTHPDRVLWPEDGFTKRMLADYYASVSTLMLPHIVGRPLSLVRCPDGIGAHCFFQRHFGQGLPSTVKPIAVRAEKQPYLMIEDEAGLFALVQFSAIELHPWGARAEDAEHPDRIVMDFDPGERVPWPRVVAAARDCRDRLDRLGLASFVKTTGGKGLHVVVPVAPRQSWSEIKQFALGLAAAMAADDDTYTTHMAKSARKGRIFIDYLRNDRTSTAIAPYSTRARAGAPVAVPLDWDELQSLPSARHYTLATVVRRIAAMRTDPWAGMARLRQRLTPKAMRAVGLEV